MFSNTAFGDDAQGSVWSVGLLGIVGGSIRCCAHPSAVASPWLLMVVSVALMLLAGLSSSSGSRAAVNLFPTSCLPILVWRASYPRDVTEIPGIRGNEVNLTFPWSTSKGITALDS
ncbi:unnamed protein product [Brassica napus]|uniref:(rape) hypothetical protein n=1 Tax=Brassica napus TaxID=3708 RepID=A0A816VJQ8_BRANA|nr:unnamed protein product [Brassica napus]